MNGKKYVITVWKDDFDIDGLTNDFSVLGEFYDLPEAEAQLKYMAGRFVLEELDQHSDWHVMDISGRPQHYQVNKSNNVLQRSSFKIGDGSGFNASYTYLELIEIPPHATVNESLFDLKNCGYEVRRYFKRTAE